MVPRRPASDGEHVNLSNEQSALLDLALDASDETLLETLGEELTRGEIGVSPPGPEELKAKARRYLASLKTSATDRLCDPDFVKSVEEVDQSDQRLAVLMIMDVISSVVVGLPAVYISILIARSTLRAWCSGGSPTRPGPDGTSQ